MLKVIAYDICNAKRLRKVAKTCELYGKRIEKSVFEVNLPEDLYQKFWRELLELIDENEDSLVVYHVNRTEEKQAHFLGCAERTDETLCFFAGR